MLSLFTRQPSKFDRTAFERDGIQLLGRFLSEPEKQVLKEILDEFHALLAAGKITRTSVHTAGDHAKLFDRIDNFASIRALAQSIVGENYCRLVSRFLIKDKSYRAAVPAHQDYPYFGGYPNKLNIFVPLTRTNAANGTLTFLKGSHRYGPLERGTIDIDRYPQLERMPMKLEVGDIAIADFLTWHYSEPSTREEDRVMVQIVYQPSTDPSSKVLVSGRILNDALCPTRETPLKVQETQICYREAANQFAHKNYAAAEQVALSVVSTRPGERQCPVAAEAPFRAARRHRGGA